MSGPGTPLTFEGYLSQQADDAIRAGADPKMVTARLGQMVAHLRAHPDIASQADEAVHAGKDPYEIAGQLSQMARHVGPYAPKEATPTDQTTTYSGDKAKAGVVATALRNLSFGLSDKGIAGLDALGDAAAEKAVGNGDFTGTLGTAYRQNLNAQHAAAAQYHQQHRVMDDLAAAAGMLGGVALTGGLRGAAGGVVEASKLAKLAAAAKVGAKYGAANAIGHSDALEEGRGLTGLGSDAVRGGVEGGIVGGATVPVAAVAGKVATTLHLPQLVSAGAERLAGVLPENHAATRALQAVAGAVGPRGAASREIASRMGMDEAAGFTPSDVPQHVSLPAMALDQAGPNVEGLAKSVVRNPGPGKTTLAQALQTRQAGMRPAISGALEETTGVPATARLQPLRDAMDARSAEGNTLYGEARTATADQPLETPTLDKIGQTPIGRQALAWGKIQKANRLAKLPTQEVQNEINPDQLQELVDMNVPVDKATAALQAKAGTTTKEIPDAETWHYAKQYLAKVARLGVHDGQGGMLATDAQGALGLWDQARQELPEAFRKADAAWAGKSRIIDAINQGRQVFRTGTNPAGRPGKALATSLDALRERAANMAPEEASGLQTGAATGAHALLATAPRSIASPGRIFAGSPERIEQMSYAFPTPGHAAEFGRAVSAWDAAQARMQRILGGSDTQANIAENATRPGGPTGLLTHLLHGNVGSAVGSLATSLGKEGSDVARRQIDAEIARILTSPDVQALPSAQRAGLLRAVIQQALLRGAAASGAETVTH